MNRQEAEAEVKLKQIFGFDSFFDDQWKTNYRGRVIMITSKISLLSY